MGLLQNFKKVCNNFIFLYYQTEAECFSFFLQLFDFSQKNIEIKQVGIAFIEIIKAIPAKVFGAGFISLRRAKKWGSAVAKGYGVTRWGKEPFFKKVFSPQNSFATSPGNIALAPFYGTRYFCSGR